MVRRTYLHAAGDGLVSLGLLVAVLSKTPFQAAQMMTVVVVPQILLYGLFDLFGTPTWMQVLGGCMPLTYGGEVQCDGSHIAWRRAVHPFGRSGRITRAS